MLKKILFPVDFSPPCIAMAAYVKRVAEIFHAEVTMVHVCDLSSHNGFELYARPSSEIAREHQSLAESKLEGFLKSELAVNDWLRVLSAGDPATGIIETAKKNKIDLIIIPTHAGRFRQVLLGSTTAKVLNDSECPVLTGLHVADSVPRPLEHREWICALGLSLDSERVLRYAHIASRMAGAKLSVIHAIPSFHAESESQRWSDEEKKASRNIAELQAKVGSNAHVSVVAGPIREALLAEAQRGSADLLVVGRSMKTDVFGRLTDLTYSLIRDSPCPVVSV